MDVPRANNHKTDFVRLPTFSIYLIGFTMLFMVLAIIVLAVALYSVLKKKSIFGLNCSDKQYVRQESTGVTPLYSASYDEQNKNNGSTLTVNSGIIEISEPRTSVPTTPTRIDDTKITFAKRPLKAIVPVMHRGQMDAICKEVLRKVQKSDSASFRDLNDLLKFDKKGDNLNMKSEDVKESENENKNDEKAELKVETQLFKLKKPEIKKETRKEIKTETQNAIKTEIKNETKLETTNKTTAIIESKTNSDEFSDVRIEVNTVESEKNEDDSSSETEYDTVPSPIRFRHSGPEPDQTMYDNVPNLMSYRHSGPEPDQTMYDTVSSPKRYRHSGPESDLEDIPLYDLPPTRSQDSPRNVIQMDMETHYLMPISAEKTDSCYINAKRQSFHST